jgi:hypothetical protein
MERPGGADQRRRVTQQVAQYLGCSVPSVHKFFERESRSTDPFLQFADGTHPIIVLCTQPPPLASPMVESDRSSAHERPTLAPPRSKQLVMPRGEAVPMIGSLAFFLRFAASDDSSGGASEPRVASGAFGGSPVEVLCTLLEQVYLPILAAKLPRGLAGEDGDGDEEAFGQDAVRKSRRPLGWAGLLSGEMTAEFMGGLEHFVELLSTTVRSDASATQLRRPDKEMEAEDKAPAFQRAARNIQLLTHYEEIVNGWCDTVDEVLQRVGGDEQAMYHLATVSGKTAAGGGAGAAATVAALMAAQTADDRLGPKAEFEMWKARVTSLASLLEQARGRDCKVVVSVLTVAKSNVLRRWKPLDMALSDALGEARDNVRLLSAVEKHAQPLYTGTPGEMAEALPGLIASLKGLNAMSRYYASPNRLSGLLAKCTNQMVARCRAHIEGADGVWAQPIVQVSAKLRECLELHAAYQEAYKSREKSAVAAGQKSRVFELNETTVFQSVDAFCRRLDKLVDVFATMEQVQPLAACRLRCRAPDGGHSPGLLAAHPRHTPSSDCSPPPARVHPRPPPPRSRSALAARAVPPAREPPHRVHAGAAAPFRRAGRWAQGCTLQAAGCGRSGL